MAKPLAAPSANLFGHVSPTSAVHVAEQLSDSIACVLDGGDCDVGVESTIVLLTENEEVTILRFGGVSVQRIEELVGHRVESRLHSSDKPEAPGQLSKHYATRKPLSFWDGDAPPTKKGSVLMVVCGAAPAGSDQFERVVVLSEDGDLTTSAHKLFSTMRQLDSDDNVLAIFATKCDSKEGLGPAINDRLTRAACQT